MLNPLLNVNKRKLNRHYLILKTHDEASRKEKIAKIFSNAKKEIKSLKAIAVVETDSGLPLGSLLIEKDFDIDAACAYNTEVLKANIRTMKALGIKDEEISDLSTELSSQTHLIRPFLEHEFFLCLAVNNGAMNMGIIKKMINSIVSELKDILDT